MHFKHSEDWAKIFCTLDKVTSNETNAFNSVLVITVHIKSFKHMYRYFAFYARNIVSFTCTYHMAGSKI